MQTPCQTSMAGTNRPHFIGLEMVYLSSRENPEGKFFGSHKTRVAN